jgi:hypothetical protein
MRLTDEQITALRDGTEGVSPGPWCLQGAWMPKAKKVRGWLSTACRRPPSPLFALNPFVGGTIEHIANASHIARCDPDTIHAIATEVLETRALLASLDEERLEEIITDSIDLDWTPRTAARAIVRAMKGGE